jgi:ABC-2 type transport system ATP-binding protein
VRTRDAAEQHDVVPESLNLGQRNLEDVFLELTGRALADEADR